MALSNAFKDKVVVVTGGSNGIGEATVSLFLEQGAHVASLDIRKTSLLPHNRRLDLRCDVSSDDEVKDAIQQVMAKWQNIDVLCNVAGITDISARVGETTDEELARMMNVNFYGPFYVMRAVIPHMLARDTKPKGSIVNVCSIAAVRGGCNGASYTSAKHALLGLTRQTAVGYAAEGIRCNSILPGPVKTNIIAHSRGEVLHPDGGPVLSAAMKPLLGFSEPIDIAKGIVFLAGAEGANGTELCIDHAFIVR